MIALSRLRRATALSGAFTLTKGHHTVALFLLKAFLKIKKIFTGESMTIKDKVKRLLEFNNKLTNQQIADAIGESRQLVSYHIRTLNMPRQSPNRVCNWCGKRITRENSSGLCREHRPLAYVYEFVCAQCGEVQVVEGHDASNRRNSRKRKKNPLDFCNNRCSGKYYFVQGDSLPDKQQ